MLKSAQDLRRVEILLSVAPPDVEGALFHSQQAAEKALKGFLCWHDVPFRRTHELEILASQCIAVDSSLTDPLRQADTLTRFAWRFRYPGSPFLPDLEEGNKALAIAREILQAVLARLPWEVHP